MSPNSPRSRRDEPRPERVDSRSDDGNPFVRGAVGIGLVTLISLGASLAGLLMAVLVSLGY